MTLEWIFQISAMATVFSAIIAGVFLTFSDFVMRSLKAAEPVAGIEAMQLINRKVYLSIFMVLLLGMAPVSMLIALIALTGVSGAAPFWLVSGGTIYVIGVFGVTMVCNVPMNKRLDVMNQKLPGTETYWVEYVTFWTRWNHVRTLASAVSAICYFEGVLLLAQA